MSYYVIDVESDGPYPAHAFGYSMVCLGAVKVTSELNETFYGPTKPISKFYEPSALAISGFNREQHETFADPAETIQDLYDWINETTVGRPVMFSDNPAYDWQFVNYYSHYYIGRNPFGWSARRIGDIWCGMKSDAYYKWKQHRKTKHTHNPVDDAMGNAEALLKLQKEGFKIKFK